MLIRFQWTKYSLVFSEEVTPSSFKLAKDAANLFFEASKNRVREGLKEALFNQSALIILAVISFFVMLLPIDSGGTAFYIALVLFMVPFFSVSMTLASYGIYAYRKLNLVKAMIIQAPLHESFDTFYVDPKLRVLDLGLSKVVNKARNFGAYDETRSDS